jgi:phosphoglycerate dehydrogenase-like enzyme
MKVLFLGTSSMLHPWYEDVLEEIKGRWPVHLHDPSKPIDDQFKGVDVVIDQGGAHGTRALIDAGLVARVKLWQVLGTGLDHTDVRYFLEKGMPLANTPGPFSAVALAEHALFMMLFFAKKFVESQESIRSKVMCQPMNEELGGKTLGLIGLGASGRELAKRSAVLGMRNMAVDAVEVPEAVQAECRLEFFGGSQQLDHLLAEADYLSLHLPLTSKSRHLIDRQTLSRMKSAAVLINVSRGEIVDEVALLEALKSGKIRGAGLDVFAQEPVNPDHPLLQLPNVIATPHCAGVTYGTSRRRAQAVVQNLERISQGLSPYYQITSVE